ncbi:MAG TPA: protein-glutamate O-methyltransferase CheR [Longimicrobiales bacterium]|nr:protein-glutamate O-methyltransferase CheR [Longimicrobiales bacterium]
MRPRRRRADLPAESAPPALLPLAQGELSPRDAGELRELKRMIQRTLGLHCDAYKEPCLRRRLAVRMRARGLHSYRDYAAVLEQDVAERDRLLDAITITVSKFFRTHEAWEVLRRKVIPELFKNPLRSIRIWSAGCAGGEEPYTLAIVLRQYAEAHEVTRQLRRFDILATDIDRGILEHAAKGEFSDFAFTEVDARTRERYFEGNRVREDIRRMVRFEELDLMTEPFPQALHLVICRNVIIYFERTLQERLFSQFYDCLVPGGFLVLGKVETIFGPAARRFKTLATRERIFCRP